MILENAQYDRVRVSCSHVQHYYLPVSPMLSFNEVEGGLLVAGIDGLGGQVILAQMVRGDQQ